MDKKQVKDKLRSILEPALAILASMGVPPMLVSLFGLAFSLYGAVVVAEGSLFLGAIFLLLSGLCDVLDGDLARRRGSTSVFGAFIDSTLDRVAEFAYFGGIIVYVVNRAGGFNNYEVVIVMVALSGSVLTSYARARAEGLGLECTVGILERPERLALLVVGLMLGYRILIGVMTILAVATTYTFLQRIVHVYRVTKTDATPATPPESNEATGEDR